MEALPARARVYVVCVALAALACLSALPAVRTPWWAVASPAVLYAVGEQVAAKWNKLQKGTAGLAADPVERKTFLADMQLAMRIGDKILATTKP